jgi:UDP-N-acetylglucosamine--N-acetylmuramyl-(pentapeptide) pyrophosphoryl-undecaprenol N-acetylglucosamine transferase
MARAGGAEVIDDAELDPARLAALAAELLADRPRLERMGAAAASLARPDAAERIAAEILAACR